MKRRIPGSALKIGIIGLMLVGSTSCRTPIPDGAFGAIPTGTDCWISWLEPDDWNATGNPYWLPFGLAFSAIPLPVCANS